MDVVPTCEVENQTVLKDLLIKRPGQDYQIVHLKSADKGGISNSLLFRNRILVLAANLILYVTHLRTTPNIYKFSLKIKDNKTEIMVFVTYWHSYENSVQECITLAEHNNPLLDNCLKVT